MDPAAEESASQGNAKKTAPFAWGKSSATSGTAAAAATREKTTKALSLAEIMAEESATRTAAQAAYDNQLPLAEIEAEQERLFRSFQEAREAKPTAPQVKAPAAAAPTIEERRRGFLEDQAFSQRALDEIERTEIVVDNPNSSQEKERQREGARAASARSSPKLRMEAPKQNEPAWLADARKHLSEQEILEIEQAMRDADVGESASSNTVAAPPATASLPIESSVGLSEEETAAIAAALREADAKQDEESLMMALQMQQQELRQAEQEASRRSVQGNVRMMTRAELDFESQRVSGLYADRTASLYAFDTKERSFADAQRAMLGTRAPLEEDYDEEGVVDGNAGFRMNSASAYAWSRRDRNTIIGPNNEIRTKHDVHVQGQANAHYLGLDEDDFGLRTHVGNQAFNSFQNNMKRTTKGVAAHGTGRAGTDSDAVKGKAMDPHVRLQISKAINNGLIEHCNGAIKQGKEAVVYHAEQGVESQGHDVAVKVFKRITEFRGRGAYVDGDPRYANQAFSNSSERKQLELWAEKEYRNLVRAHRSKVPVPTPLHYNENVIFMRFMGNDGWPAPQIREIDMKKGSKKWDILYTQAMEAIRR